MPVKRYRPYRRQKRQLQASTSTHSYGVDWPKISAYVKHRDDYRCQIAKLTHGRDICSNRFPPPMQHLLHAHHIQERSAGGTDHPRNLITLCCVCHGNLHGRRLGRITLRQIEYAKRLNLRA